MKKMNLTEIRNIVRQHNKLSVIKGVDSKTKSVLLKEISSMGYEVDHDNKKIMKSGKSITSGAGGEVKPNKLTKRKRLVAGGDKPVLSKGTTKGEVRKTARRAYEPKKASAPPIPKNKGGKKIKPDRSSLLVRGSSAPKAGTKKGQVRLTARRAYEPTGGSSDPSY